MARITGIAIVTYVFVVCTSYASSDFSRITSDSLRLGRTLAGFENVGRSGGYVETEFVREINKNNDGGFVPSPGYVGRQSKALPSSISYSSHISQAVPSSNYRSQQQVASTSSGFTASDFARKPIVPPSPSFHPQIAPSHLNSTVLPSSSSLFNNNSESHSARSSARSRGFIPSPTSYPDELSVVASPHGNVKAIEDQKVLYKLAGQHTTTRASNSNPSDDIQSAENDEEEEEEEEEEISEEESGDEESEETGLTTIISTRPIVPAVEVQSKAKRKTRGKKVKKIKGFKKFKKYLLPLVIAYKLKFLMLIPLLLGGLVLLVGTTGFAGFFFALFAVGISLRKE